VLTRRAGFDPIRSWAKKYDAVQQATCAAEPHDYLSVWGGSVGLDPRELDHLGPLGCAFGDELCDVGGRTWKHPRT